MEYYSAIKMNKILPSATTWMDLEDIVVSGVHQRERQISYVESREQDKQTNNRNKLIDRESILMVVRFGVGG